MEVYKQGSNESLMWQALSLARLGWPIIPLHYCTSSGTCSCGKESCPSVAKHPLTISGCKDATTDPVSICSWWQKWPLANVGVGTGSPSGLIVVDIDPRHGGDKSWQAFQTRNSIPKTQTVRTGGGGLHFYFKAPKQVIKNRANLLPGVDIRGEGGYVVAPPSVHKTGTIYSWDGDFDLLKLAELPTLLIELIESPRMLLQSSIDESIPEGARNTTLASVAGTLRRHGLAEDAINKALQAINSTICRSPLPFAEVQGIARSIMRYEVNGDQVQWPEPKPLPEIKALVPKMSEDILPKPLQAWAADICDRMQIPLEFIAAPAIICLSTVIGRQIGIYPKQKDDWFVIPNLWGAVIARPGFFKSPAIAEALKPLEQLVKREREKYQAALILSKSKEDIHNASMESIKDQVRKAIRRGNQEEIAHLQVQLENSLKEKENLPVIEKRYKTNDATIEKIGSLLLENPLGIMIFRDELSGWLKSLQKSGREGDREFFLEAWNGYGSYTVDRIGRGTLHIPSLCLSIFGGLQPGKLDSYIYQATLGGEGDDGLLQRFQILVYPEASKKWKNVDRKPDEESKEAVWTLFEKLAQLDTGKIRKLRDAQVPGLRFSHSAQEKFNFWREKLENRLRTCESETPAFEAHLSKYRSLVPSLSLIFHLCEYPTLSITEVGDSSLEQALKWADLLESHARKIYSNVIHSELRSAHALMKKIQSNAVTSGMTVRSIYRKGWSHLESSSQVDKALALLEDSGWLQIEQIKGATKAREEIVLNPRLWHEPLST